MATTVSVKPTEATTAVSVGPTDRFRAMIQAMAAKATSAPLPKGVKLDINRPAQYSKLLEEELAAMDAATEAVGVCGNNDLNLVLRAIDARASHLTINRYIAEAANYPGVTVPGGDDILFRPCADESITRNTLEQYTKLSINSEWEQYYPLYAENGVYVIRTGAGLDNPQSPLAIGRENIIQVLGGAIESLAPFFKTAPGDSYAIKGNMVIYMLQNTLTHPVTGDLYDFPNIVHWFLNETGEIALEIDSYDLISAGAIVNGFFDDLEAGSNVSGLGRSATALPVPAAAAPASPTNPYPTLATLDAFQTTMTIGHRLLQRAKVAVTSPVTDNKLFSTAFSLAEVRCALNLHLLTGNLLRAMNLYYHQYTEDVVYLPNDFLNTQSRTALAANQNAALAAMPNVSTRRIDFYTIKGNQCTALVWFDMRGKSGKYYSIPKYLQMYYIGGNKFHFQEDFVDEYSVIVLTAMALADQ